MQTPPENGHHAWAVWVRVTSVLGFAALSFLPVSTRLGFEFARAESLQSVGWSAGILVWALLAALVMLVLRDSSRTVRLMGAVQSVVRWWSAHPVRATIVLACVATGAYLTVAWRVFDARPLLIDEIVQVLQARTFASGQLWLPVSAQQEFRSVLHMVEFDGRWFAQFPPGGPAMLAIGELVRAPWLVNPIAGGVAVGAFSTAIRWAGMRTGVVVGTSLAFAFAPFVVFQSASHMNHVTTLMWLTIAVASLVRACTEPREHIVAALCCGLALGVAATVRPIDAAAWALPAAAWLAWRAVTRGHWRALAASGVGVALPMLIMMWVNWRTTGGPFTFGYTVLWGQAHGLGFHVSPWGESHTVARGVALVATYLSRLSEYLFESPIPSLMPAFAYLALAPRLAPLERYLAASSVLILLAYFAYWHDGFYLGPRFVYSLAPVCALFTVQFVSWIHEQGGGRAWLPRATISGFIAAAVVSIAFLTPLRARLYAAGFQSARWDYDSVAREAGARGATILVRESWGAQVIARLWALGVSRPLAEVLYRSVDTCLLDESVHALERAATRGVNAEARLLPLMRDSSRVVPSDQSPDNTERMLPGSVYGARCGARIMEDRAGYTHLAPTLLSRDTSIRWVRDLHARDTLLLRSPRASGGWLLTREIRDGVWAARLQRLPSDSLDRDWYGPGFAMSGIRSK